MMKRFFDIIASLIILSLSLPIMGTISLCIIYHFGRPVFFKQLRLGYKGEEFRIIKFRTMKNSCNELGECLSDEQRITPFGHFLRATSLDELPQIFNVLKGEMSLVGPRPHLAEFKDLYTEEQFKRHEVKPGITGWAQVNGRNNLDWEKRFELDLWYIENRSFCLDMLIIAKTFKAVFSKEGIQAPGYATMPRFKGNENSSNQNRKIGH